MPTKPTKSVKQLTKELHDLSRQMVVVQKEREAKLREQTDLTKKFKVGQMWRFTRYNDSSGVVVYKVLKVHKDKLVTQQVWISDSNIVIYAKKVNIMWWNTKDAIRVDRKKVVTYLRNLSKLVKRTERMLLD